MMRAVMQLLLMTCFMRVLNIVFNGIMIVAGGHMTCCESINPLRSQFAMVSE